MYELGQVQIQAICHPPTVHNKMPTSPASQFTAVLVYRIIRGMCLCKSSVQNIDAVLLRFFCKYIFKIWQNIIKFTIYLTFRYSGSTSTASSQYSNFSTTAKLKDTSAASNTSHYERYAIFFYLDLV